MRMRHYLDRAMHIAQVLVTPKRLKLAIHHRLRKVFPELTALPQMSGVVDDMEIIQGRLHLEQIRPRAAGSLDHHDEGAKPHLLIDMRITQIVDRDRGIPRYSNALACALPDQLGDAQITYLIDAEAPEPASIDVLKARGNVIASTEDILDVAPVTHFLQSCLFEYHKNVEDLVPIELRVFQPKIAATVYDLIPGLYPDQYLKDTYLKSRYRYMTSMLAHFDHLFSISECTKQDVVKQAYIPQQRITNIYGGIDLQVWDNAVTIERTADGSLRLENEGGREFSVTGDYWLYVGGADFRKNLARAVEAFALMLQDVEGDKPCLVIACGLPPSVVSETEKRINKLGMRVGVDVVLTNRVSDSVLKTLYTHAFAVVFPSLYEGLGLPVLEAYHFGTPVIASNTSALVEITHPDALFDPEDPRDIARAMIGFHRDVEQRETSIKFGRDMLDKCNWEAAARCVADWVRNDSIATTVKPEPLGKGKETIRAA